MFSRIHRHDVAYLSKGVSTTLKIRYDSAGIVSDVLNMRYDIFNLVAKTLEMIYSIPIVYVATTLDIIYDSRIATNLRKNLGTFIVTDSIDIGDMTV